MKHILLAVREHHNGTGGGFYPRSKCDVCDAEDIPTFGMGPDHDTIGDVIEYCAECYYNGVYGVKRAVSLPPPEPVFRDTPVTAPIVPRRSPRLFTSSQPK